MCVPLHVGVCEYERAGAAEVCGAAVGVGDVVGAVRVAGNGLGDKGGTAVAGALKTNTTLRQLHLVGESGGGWVVGSVWDGGEEAGREGCWGGGRRVWRCWRVCVCMFVSRCGCLYVFVKFDQGAGGRARDAGGV